MIKEKINKEKLVSVAIPVFNGEKYIAESIESILKQDYQELEILISDNFSNDNLHLYMHYILNQFS